MKFSYKNKFERGEYSKRKINVKRVLRAGGAGLSDEQREEMTNREGVAAGGAT